MCKRVALFGLLFLACASASAETAWRFGVSAAKVDIKMDDFDVEGDSTGWSVFGGYEFNPYLAVEAGYMDAGEAKDEIMPGVVATADTNALFASVLGSLPLGESASVFGRAGLLSWESSQTGRVDGQTVIEEDFDGTDPYFGAGITGTVDNALLRLEYGIADLDDSDVTMLGLSIVWRF